MSSQQIVERQSGEVLALEQDRFERARIGRADDQVLIEQEQPSLTVRRCRRSAGAPRAG
jgi:hypothetical protein